MMKKAVLFLLLAAALPVQAQRFEWAKGYTDGEIKGSVTDSAGNLYILGTFHIYSEWDGTSLMPMAPYGPVFNTTNVLIAKITPDGDMAWKKVIHCNNGNSAIPWDIKPVGDTAFACLVTVEFPSMLNYCYYLDTLLPTWSDYPMYLDQNTVLSRTFNALITFDFDGNMLEQHFIQMTYVDSEGNDIVIRYSDGRVKPENREMQQLSFDVDSLGNVYLCRVAVDWVGQVDTVYNAWTGNIRGIKYWVDQRLAGCSAVENRPLKWFPQLLKFGPHMDTLLAARYVVQQCDSAEYQNDNLYLRLDRDGNPYVVGTFTPHMNLEEALDNTFVIDSSKNIFFSRTTANQMKGYLVKYDTSLNAIYCLTLQDSVIHPEIQISNNLFHDISFDSDSNLMFLYINTARASFSDTTNFYSVLVCQGHPLNNLKNEGFFISFRMDDDSIHYHSYGIAKAQMASGFTYNNTGNFVCKKNRVFMQLVYAGGIRTDNQSLSFPHWYDVGLGFSILDYQGNIIHGEHYSSFSQHNRPKCISLHDSVLYLSNYLATDATFGNIHVSAGNGLACMAKYVDTAFMTPYVSPIHNRILPTEKTALCLYPNPAQERITIDLPDGTIEAAYLINVHGKRERVDVHDGIVGLNAVPAGVYILELTTDNHKYHQKIIVL